MDFGSVTSLVRALGEVPLREFPREVPPKGVEILQKNKRRLKINSERKPLPRVQFWALEKFILIRVCPFFYQTQLYVACLAQAVICRVLRK